MPIEMVCLGFGILGGLIGMLLFCLIWDDGFRVGQKRPSGASNWAIFEQAMKMLEDIPGETLLERVAKVRALAVTNGERDRG